MVSQRRWWSQDWGRVLKTAATEFRADHAAIVASGVAFRATLAVFPAIALLVWAGGELIGEAQVRGALRSSFDMLPDSTRSILEQAMKTKLAEGPGSRGGGSDMLGSAAPLTGLLLTVCSTNSGVKALFTGFNTIFEKTEKRSFLRLTGITLAFTAGAFLLSLLVLALLVVLPYALSLAGLPSAHSTALAVIRWPLLFLVLAAALGLLSRYAPHRGSEDWPFLTIGSLAAALVLVLGSVAFSWFVGRFASLTVTYGSLSTIIAFMIWLWLSFGTVFAGAEIDAAIRGAASAEDG